MNVTEVSVSAYEGRVYICIATDYITLMKVRQCSTWLSATEREELLLSSPFSDELSCKDVEGYVKGVIEKAMKLARLTPAFV